MPVNDDVGVPVMDELDVNVVVPVNDVAPVVEPVDVSDGVPVTVEDGVPVNDDVRVPVSVELSEFVGVPEDVCDGVPVTEAVLELVAVVDAVTVDEGVLDGVPCAHGQNRRGSVPAPNC